MWETDIRESGDRDSRVTQVRCAADQCAEIKAGLLSTLQSRDLRSLSGLAAVLDVVRLGAECQAAAIRLIDEAGYAPYEAHLGFPEHFCPRRNLLNLAHDRCLCTQVLTEAIDPDDPGLTPAGSLIYGTTAELRSAQRRLPDLPAHLFCPDPGLAAMALIPIRGAGFPLGLLHCADPRPHHFQSARVALLEAMADEIGRALFLDSIWPSPWTPPDSLEAPASCPICGRYSTRGGHWEDRGPQELQRNSWSVRRARHVLCPNCLASQIPA